MIISTRPPLGGLSWRSQMPPNDNYVCLNRSSLIAMERQMVIDGAEGETQEKAYA